MDDAELRRRLWEGFAALQTLLGGSAKHGFVIEKPGLVASIVPSAPDSPALNAAVAIEPQTAPATPRGAGSPLRRRRRPPLGGLGRRRRPRRDRASSGKPAWRSPPRPRAWAPRSTTSTSTSRPRTRARTRTSRTVGRVNDLAYGNVDSRLERTLTTLQEGSLRGYKADLNGAPAAVALALHHGEDCGVSFVATVPQARRHGLATQVMRSALADARRHDLTTITLQATELGERLYHQLGLKRLSPMELWERRR